MQLRASATTLAGCVLAIFASFPVSGQNQSAHRDTGVIPSRAGSYIDDAQRVILHGNTHPMARSRFEAGRVLSSLRMDRISLILQRSPEQDAALKTFNERQYDPKSPDYHRWLEPAEFGKLYGPSDADIAAITNWLQLRGFQIYEVNKGRTMIQFSGTAAQVEQAFQVEMHHYNVNGEQHIANDRDPSIPEALSPVIVGVASLHDFFAKPQHILGKQVVIDPRSGRKMLASSQTLREKQEPSQLALSPPVKSDPTPQLTYTDHDGNTREDVTPYDLATIYNILPLWQASTPINGTGVNIAISGVSDIKQADVDTFRTAFGLPAMTLQTVVNGIDPGIDTKGGGAVENTLDVEMAGATAPGAQIVLVVSADTATTSADFLSDEYIIDNKTAPIMSASYGECELGLGTAGNLAYNTLWQQGMTEGISIFESSGDQGSAGCANQDLDAPNYDVTGLQVNGLASSPSVTAVGGTDFTWSFVKGGTTTYWNTNNGTQLQTAKGIMPEVPWNSTCTSTLLVQAFGESSAEQLCNAALSSGTYEVLDSIASGSGGTSYCTQPTGSTTATCAGGYAKPSWQTGYGVSTTNRDLPDVSLFASSGFPSESIDGSALLFCYSAGGYACNYSSVNLIEAQEVGGTSASSPMMAGIMALVVQRTNQAQGLANPILYQLYGSQVSAGTSCNSATVANGNSCIFYDVAQGTNSQVCKTGDPNCVTNTASDQLGVLSGFNATAGYDDAVGLGSLNVANLVNAWPATSTPAPTYTLSLSTGNLTFPSTVNGAVSAAQSVTIQNTGTGTVTLSESLTGANPSSYLISANTCTNTLLSGSSCVVSVEFTPNATGSLSASLTITDNATGSPQSVTLTGTATATPTAIVSLSPTSLVFGSQTVTTSSASQAVMLSNTGTASLTINGIGITGVNIGDFSETNNCGGSVAGGGSCIISVVFTPSATGTRVASVTINDSATPASQSVPLTGTGATAVVVTPTINLSPSSLTFPSQTIATSSTSQAVTLNNTGSVALTINGISIAGLNTGDFSETNTCGGSLAGGSSCTIRVVFTPTTAGTRSASLAIADNAANTPQIVTLSGTGATASTPGFTLSSNPTTLTVMHGSTVTTALTVTPTNGFNQAVSFSCSGLPTGAACSFSPSTVTPGGAAATTTLTLSTAAATTVAKNLEKKTGRNSGEVFALTGLLGFILLGSRARKRIANLLLLAFFTVSLLSLQGCSNHATGVTSSGGTPSGTYTVTVMASSTGGSVAATNTAAITLIVQ